MANPTPPLSFAAPAPGTNPYLLENFAPVTEEQVRHGGFTVTGVIPPDLDGMLLRNGPNPAVVDDPATYHWFTGDGMVHGLYLRDGELRQYRNRLVRTRHLSRELGTPQPKGPKEAIDGGANTNIVFMAKRLLALVESGLPHRLDAALDTICVEDFDGALASPMTAHPKVDPATGTITFFGYDPFGPPYLRYHEMDPVGNLLHSTDIALDRCVMVHDVAVSATRVGFMDLPIVLDPTMGGTFPFRFDTERGAKVGILHRGRPGSEITWYALEPCYVFHVANAFDDGEDFVMDVCCYERTFDRGVGGLLGTDLARMERWRMSPGNPRVQRRTLDDLTVEFPRIDDAMAQGQHRFTYAVRSARRDGLDRFSGLVKFDHQRDESVRIDLPEGRECSEAVFVRAEDGRTDEEGYLLTVVYDKARHQSDLVIYDAHSMREVPWATVELPVRIPHGFHGNFVPTAALS